MGTWTNKSKNSATWTNTSDTIDVGLLASGSPIGLLLALTYTTSIPATGVDWGNVSKNSSSWTNKTKN